MFSLQSQTCEKLFSAFFPFLHFLSFLKTFFREMDFPIKLHIARSGWLIVYKLRGHRL